MGDANVTTPSAHGDDISLGSEVVGAEHDVAATGASAASSAASADAGAGAASGGAASDVPGRGGFDPDVARVVRGNPSDDELAAVVAVLASVFEAGSQADRPRDLALRRSGWERSQRTLRGATGDPFGTPFGR